MSLKDSQSNDETRQDSASTLVGSEVQFRSEDISKQKRTRFFLHVKEDEDSAKAAARQAKADKRRQIWCRLGRPALIIFIVLIIATTVGFAIKYFAVKQAEEELEGIVTEMHTVSSTLSEADAYLEEGDFENAEKSYDAATEMATTNETRADLYLHRSQALSRLMYDAQADKVLEYAIKAYEFNPSYYEIVRWLAWVYERRGDTENAEKYQQEYEALIQSDEDVSETADDDYMGEG